MNKKYLHNEENQENIAIEFKHIWNLWEIKMGCEELEINSKGKEQNINFKTTLEWKKALWLSKYRVLGRGYKKPGEGKYWNCSVS
jgi:hypothetical protein